jgi:hypothetical protein
MLPFILLPNYFKWIGALFFVSGLGIVELMNPNLDDVSSFLGLSVQILILVGLLLMACSRQKIEDELMQHYRLVALQWSLLIYIGLRLVYKIIAYTLKDETWQPDGFQVNFLLMIYLVLFHYFALLKDKVLQLFNKKGAADEE